MPKIKLLAIPSDKYAVGKYRILEPYLYIGEYHSDDIHVDVAYDVPDEDSFFNGYDVVVFHSHIHRKSHEDNIKRIEWLKLQGIKVIMDIDDYWNVGPNHMLYHSYKKSEHPRRRVELLKISDYITTTTNFLQNTIRKHINKDNVFVFPNAIDETEKQFIPNPIKSEKTRFGWVGGSTHLSDISLIQSGFSQIGNQYKDKVQFTLCGFDTRGEVTEIVKETGEVRKRPVRNDENPWIKCEQIFTNNYKLVSNEYKTHLIKYKNEPYVKNENEIYNRNWTLPINEYGTNYNHLDVVLVPLVDYDFNHNKSQLKIIEAGFHKKPVIVSECLPYTIDLISSFDQGVYNEKGNALLVSPRKNHKQWTQHMKKIIENPNLIEDLGNKLYETVKDKYSLKKVSKDRVEFIKTIINN
jgi:glycosyltransferase involved in cell wall biosynthesis